MDENTDDRVAENLRSETSGIKNIRSLWKNYKPEYLADLVAGCVLIIFMLPLMVLLVLAIKLDNPGPAFVWQERGDLYGRRRMAFKFRTVRTDVLNDSYIRVVTPVGRFLRCTSMDNLPQLLNVLRGEMSVFGSSPRRPHFLD